MKDDFDSIFAEYYTLYRGQATNLPKSGDPEYQIALQLAKNAIRKWDRVDGQLWDELWTTAQEDGSGELVVAVGTFEYDAPDNMRKPPAFVNLRTGTGDFTRIKVVKPHEAENFSSLSTVAYFTGNPNNGFTLHLDNIQANYDGYDIDYLYVTKPKFPTQGSDRPQMSDPNFMIQDMLASRFANARNGFGYKTAKAEATAALLNMKIENNTGTYGNSSNLGDSGPGFGVQSADII
jgi:hypothetical protein